MVNHPNRNHNVSPKGVSVRRNPTPTEIAEARELTGLTQTEAAESIYATLRTWQDWEQDQRRMHPGLFELFRLKHGLVKISDVKKGIES